MAKRNTGIFGTLIFHLGILTFVVIFGFATPLPLPEEEGILINFGTDETGAGAQEPSISQAPEEVSAPPPRENVVLEESEEEMLAQDFEEAPAVEEQREAVPEPEQTRVIPEESTENEVVETPAEEQPREVDQRALYQGRRNTDENSQSEGVSEGEGNQGSTTGSPESDNYSNALSTGQGGIDFSLTGRNPVLLPKPEYNVPEDGTIVVRIRVDSEGKVISAEPGFRGSNSLNESLLEAAMKAALNARFSPSKDKTLIQVGTITYRFIQQK